jgi:hypothetical protein
MKLITLLVLVSCQSFQIPGIQLPTQSYMKDLDFSVMTQDPPTSTRVKGVGVVAGGIGEYAILFEPKHKVTLLRVSNCHRDYPSRYPNKSGGWFGKSKYMFSYKPNLRVENGSCVFLVSILDEHGRHQFGALAFKQPYEAVNARLHCNGGVKDQLGVSFCQGMAGSKQAIDIYGDVLVKGEEQCPPLIDAGNNKFDFKLGTDLCTYVFMDRNKKTHRLVTYGYNALIKDSK